MQSTNSQQPDSNNPPPDDQDLQVQRPVPRPFMAGTAQRPVPPPFTAGIDSVPQSAQADVAAVGHSGANLFAGSPAPDLPLPQCAFTLHCRGLHSDAIAAQLGVAPRTVRRWIQRIAAQLVPTTSDELRAELLRAVETQRAVLAAAWAAFDRETQLEDAILGGQYDHLRRRILRPTHPNDHADATLPPDDEPPGTGSPFPAALPSLRGRGAGGEVGQGTRATAVLEEYDRPYRPHAGARYLAVILAAQREIARLQNLYDINFADPNHISITITRRPEGPENFPPEERPIRFPHLYPSDPTSPPTNPDETDLEDHPNDPDEPR